MYACMYEGMYVGMFVVIYIWHVCLYRMWHVDMMLSSQTCPSKQRSKARKESSRKKTSKHQITAQNVLDSVAGRPRFLVWIFCHHAPKDRHTYARENTHTYTRPGGQTQLYFRRTPILGKVGEHGVTHTRTALSGLESLKLKLVGLFSLKRVKSDLRTGGKVGEHEVTHTKCAFSLTLTRNRERTSKRAWSGFGQ